MRSLWLSPLVILLSVVAVGFVSFVMPDLFIRPIVVMWFLFICPGLSVVSLLRLQEVVAEWTLSIALSLTIDGIVATILLYAGLWTPSGILSILMSCTCFCTLLQVITLNVTGYRSKNVQV